MITTMLEKNKIYTGVDRKDSNDKAVSSFWLERVLQEAPLSCH